MSLSAKYRAETVCEVLDYPGSSFGSTSRWGRIARPPVETGVCHAKPAEARLPVGAIAGLPVRFNALCLSDEGFNPRRRRHAPNLNYTPPAGYASFSSGGFTLRNFR